MVRAVSLLWRVAVSPVTFVVLSILWCLDLGAGSISAYFHDPRFWTKMDAYPFNLWLSQVAPKTFPLSLWVYILVGLSYLLVLSLLLCTVNWFLRRRRRLKGLAEVLVHLGFLMIFAGFVLGSAIGARTQVTVPEGERVQVPGMGLSLELRELDVVRSPQGRDLDTRSDLVLYTPDGRFAGGIARTNAPLIWGATVVYPPDDYQAGISGATVGTESGASLLAPGLDIPLPDGGALTLGGILQDGETRGGAVGPGVLVVRKNPQGRPIASAYLSPADGMPDQAVLAGVRVTLGEFREASVGLYRVHYDPGVWLVFLGAIVLTLGTIWALAAYLGILPPALSGGS